MEATSFVASSHQPVRSISLPTRTHPSSQTLDALLNHLKPIQHRSLSSSTSNYFEADTIQNDLVLVADLYNSMNDLLQSSQTQHALLRHPRGRKLVEEALCGSLILLDACGSARDLMMALKEHVQTLQSALRRRKAADSSIETSVSVFLCFRKKAKKEIAKQLSALKRMENSNKGWFCEDQSVMFVGRVVREASIITISVFRSLLLFLSMTGLKRKGSSLMSKLKPMRLLFSSEKEHKGVISETDLNVAVCCVLASGRNSNGKNEGEGAKRVLERVSDSIDGVEGRLDCVFKSLVQNRVCFLNMLAREC